MLIPFVSRAPSRGWNTSHGQELAKEQGCLLRKSWSHQDWEYHSHESEPSQKQRISDEIPSLVGNLLSIHLKGISVWVGTFSWAMKKKSPLFRGQCLSRHSFIQPKIMVKSLWYVGCRPSRCHEKEKTHILCPLGIYVWVGMPDSKTSSNHKNG